MQRIQILFLIGFLGIHGMYSQLSGSITDEQGTAIAYANVLLLRQTDQEILTGGTSDESGHFRLDQPQPGQYILRVSLLSYENWESEPFEVVSNSKERTFPPVTLAESVTQLDGVSITAQRKLIQRTPEGNVINVQQSILTKGSSALQLLERSPGVILDQRNNSFSLNGRSGTLILINGKTQRIPTEDLIALLNGMSADSIEKIELLTNPSARYDVDGNAGIINIVLAKNENTGLRGSFGANLGYGEGLKEGHNFSLTYGGERGSLFASYNFLYDDTFSGWIAKGVSDIPVLGGNTSIEFKSDRFEINRSHNTNLGYEHQLSEHSILGGGLLYNHSRPKQRIQNRGLYEFQVNPFLEAQIELNGAGRWSNINPSLFFESANEKRSFQIGADFIGYRSKTPNQVRSDYFDREGLPFDPENEIYNRGNRGLNETDINIGVLKFDYQKQLSEAVSLEGGIKASLSETINDARIEIQQGDVFISDERFISTIENREKIGAIYGIAAFLPNTKTDVQLGLRYEYWDQAFDDSSLDRSFGKLFPSVFLTRSFSDTTSLNLVYNKRITRPNYSDLASYLSYNGPTSVFSGNPQLLPAITDNVSLTYNNKGFNISLMATNEQNPIARFQITRNDLSNIAVIAPVNLDYQRSVDMQTNLPIRLSHWWNLNLNGTIGVRNFKLLHTVGQVAHSYFHYNFNGNQTMLLPGDFSFELSGWYTSEHFNGSIRIDGFGALNAGIKKDFANGSSLQFAVTDIFQSVDIRSRIGVLDEEVYGDVFTVDYSPESGFSRIYRISFTYPFGNSKVKKGKTRSGASTEKSRI
ncbi:outer membrane beta-barrel family protein [Flagellimonas flava]|uniref:Outer membrane receptor proteins, mostly Fe transport n=1 Tax=Flagellimonas flava TaxID=570519 RepID=A0A1M5IMQ5_9FLAO|nr:outer membrane beta-barrel family protein [Allomuricauda flava]SHG29329.1 Outer membrane receptor proteins, mostly Fe transport [Allomuricauda flava]